ncbi:MAG: O-antigen ligase family protein [Chlamydiales bacterium]|nr:O-antigen ligase family protein [Chlamydiia bacterium]MCP5508740.1 O-antigen ligase family protein [Chlamydiales bacterium]
MIGTIFILFLTFTALAVSIIRTPERAFLGVYLPSLFLLPQIFKMEVPGFPDVSFAQSVIIPVVIVTLIRRWYQWRFSLMDLFIFGYMFVCVYSETVTDFRDEGLGRNLSALMLMGTVGPYFLAKIMLLPSKASIAFSRRFSFLIFVCILISLYEVRFVANPWIKFIKAFFPGQETLWPVLFRFGLVRIGGPEIQPILYGIVIAAAILLCYWLIRNRMWNKRFRFLPALPIAKQWIILGVLVMGLLLTVSRGPWLSAFIGVLFLGVGFSRSKFKSFILRGFIVVGCGYIAFQTYLSYAELNKYYTGSEMTGNIAFRGEMNREYTELAMQRPIWGWGSTNWPVITGIKSVDNQYLWLLLKHGLVGLFVFIALLIVCMVRLFFRGMLSPSKYQEDSSLAFALLGVMMTISTALITVYMGMQVEPLLFLIIGWSEGLVISRYGDVMRDPIAVKMRELEAKE